MINFTVGPVQMDDEIREIASEQIPYFRTPEFSEITKESEKIFCNLFDAPEDSRVVFLTGSGTASMEASVMNFFTSKDKVLVVNGGSFGHRFAEICSVHKIPYEEIKLEAGYGLSEEKLAQYNNKGFTGFLVQLCETSTGVKYDIKTIGKFCKKNGIFLVVDCISGFLADYFSMKEMHVNAAITGSQKALALPPSMSYICMDKEAQSRCENNKESVGSVYFNLADYLKNGERGQTPFTPAVGTMIQLNARLKSIEKKGGIKSQNKLLAERAEYFRNSIKNLPLRIFTQSNALSNCVTALSPITEGVSAYHIFEMVKDEFSIWMCPNGGDLRDKVIRVGHIGNISNEEIDKLVEALKTLNKRGEI